MNCPNRPLSGHRPLGNTRLSTLLLALLLVGAMLSVYGRVCRHQFLVWDDKRQIVDNRQLNPVTWHGVGRFWREPYWNLYIPLSYTFFAAEASIARRPLPDGSGTAPNPMVFHTGNLLLHIACVLLVFVILRKLFRHDGAACAGALLFGLHPVQVESVAWASEARGLLCAMFALLAVWQYLRHAVTDRGTIELQATPEAAAETSSVEMVPYLLATACFMAALLCKPSAVAVPLIVVLLDFGLIGRPWRRILPGIAPWLVLAIGSVILTKQLQPDTLLADVSPLWARPLLAGEAMAFYLLKLIAPLRCGPDYGHDPAWVRQQPWFFFAWMLPAAVLTAMMWMKHRRRWLVAAAVSIASVLPVLGFVPFLFQRISTVADRYLYLALLGPALLLCWLLTHRWNRLTVGLTSLMLCLLALLSFVQAGYWADNETLLRHALSINPRSVIARTNRGFLLAEQGRHAEAVRQYRLALEDHPSSPEVCLNLATSLAAQGQHREAIEHYRAALAINPKLLFVHVNLAHALAAEGRRDEAVTSILNALRLVPAESEIAARIRRILSTYQDPKDPYRRNSQT